MFQQLSFTEMIRGVRAGDQKAAAALVCHFEPAVARFVRNRLYRLNLHRVLEVADICQTVMANFFVHASDGCFVLHRPVDLRKLLCQMARNQVLNEARRYRAHRRDPQRLVQGLSQDALDLLRAVGPSPSTIVAGHELIRELYRCLSEGEAPAGRSARPGPRMVHHRRRPGHQCRYPSQTAGPRFRPCGPSAGAGRNALGLTS